MAGEKWGPDNPHPLSRMKTELVWEGKYDEFGERRKTAAPSHALVLQRIETIDEPRDRTRTSQGDLFDQAAYVKQSHRDDYRNLLIWGDNRLALMALNREFHSQVKLAYIDPPFDVGADFKLDVLIGDGKEELHKDQSVMEAVAYRDAWGKGVDSYYAMMADRIALIKDLLTSDGSFYLHCDWRVAHGLRQICDELFGRDCFQREIIWRIGWVSGYKTKAKNWIRNHDTLLFYTNSNTGFEFNKEYIPYPEGYRRRDGQEPTGPGYAIEDTWNCSELDRMDSIQIMSFNNEKVGYDTQKNENLLERVIKSATSDGDLVLDCFCGSGTSQAVAEKLGRRWIGVDLGRYAIHTTRKRLIQVQRELHAGGQPYRSFDLYNLGRYERQWWQQERLKGADDEHRAAVLKFFRAQPLANAPHPHLHATKAGAYVHVDKIDTIFTLDELREVARAAAGITAEEDLQLHGLTESRRKIGLVVLAWEFEMDLRLRSRAIEAEYNLDIQLKYIPREIMEPNRDKLQFFDAAALDCEPLLKDGAVDIKLTMFYPSLTEVPEKELDALKERAVKSPFDFIDFWAIDFDHKEGQPFEHHWQDFRTRKDRSLKTTSDAGHKYDKKGNHQICVKVIDVFGIDTTKVIEVKA